MKVSYLEKQRNGHARIACPECGKQFEMHLPSIGFASCPNCLCQFFIAEPYYGQANTKKEKNHGKRT